MTIFWSRTLLFESPEQGLLGTQDLNGGCWKLRKVGKTSCVCEQLGTKLGKQKIYIFADKAREVGGNSVHLVLHETLQARLEIKVRNQVLAKSLD